MSPSIEGSFEFGDDNGLDMAMNRAIAIVTDNRTEGSGGADSVDVSAAGRVMPPLTDNRMAWLSLPQALSLSLAKGNHFNQSGN
jgi:hypothetical protein